MRFLPFLLLFLITSCASAPKEGTQCKATGAMMFNMFADAPDTANTAQGETKEIPINIKYEDDSPFSICTQVMVAIFDGNKSYNQQSEIGRIGILSSEGSKLLKSRLTVSKAKLSELEKPKFYVRVIKDGLVLSRTETTPVDVNSTDAQTIVVPKTQIVHIH